MKTFEFEAAKAVYRPLDNGVGHVVYTGEHTQAALDYLRAKVLHAAQDSAVLLVRMEKALLYMERMAPVLREAYMPGIKVGAIVVRADQYKIAEQHVLQLAGEGVSRVLFLETQLALAYSWAERRAKPRGLPVL